MTRSPSIAIASRPRVSQLVQQVVDGDPVEEALDVDDHAATLDRAEAGEGVEREHLLLPELELAAPLDVRPLVAVELVELRGQGGLEVAVALAQALDESGQLLRGEGAQLHRSLLAAELPDQQQADEQRDAKQAELCEAAAHRQGPAVGRTGTPSRKLGTPTKAASVMSSSGAHAYSSPNASMRRWTVDRKAGWLSNAES